MVLDIAKPFALLLCILSLYADFHAAFLVQAANFHDRIHGGLVYLLIAAGISILGGLLFQEASPEQPSTLISTLPVKVFCWASTGMLLLFGASWYLETYCVFYRNLYY